MTTFRRAWMRPWHVDAGGALALAALATACYLFFVQPVLDRRSEARAHALELASQREAVTRLRAARQDTEVRLAEIRRAVADQSVRLEPRNHVNQRLDTLTSLAVECGVEVERLAPGATADTSRHGTMSLRFTGRAPYAACEAFISRLHARFNDTALTSLRLASAQGAAGPVTIEIELLWFTAPDLKVDAQKR